MAVALTKRLFTVDEFHRMVGAGILSEDDRVELIDGEIVQMAPINEPHAQCVDRLAELFYAHCRETAVVRVQGPVRLDERSQVQPDIALLRRHPAVDRQRGPGPDDVLLVVEVSDTTLREDRHVTVPLYARTGIREAWVVDLSAERIEVYRTPIDGASRETTTVTRGEVAAPLAFPDTALRVDDLFG